MHSKTSRTLERCERALRDRIRPRIYESASSLQIESWAVGGEPIPAKIALGLEDSSEATPKFTPFTAGQMWGAPWDTVWFKFSGTAPQDPENYECVIDLGWEDHSVGFQCEGLVYLPDGTVVKALNPKNRWIRLGDVAQPGQPFIFFIEAASNPLLLEVPPFRPTALGEKPKSFDTQIYQLRDASIYRKNAEVAQLVIDIEVLEGLAKSLPADTARRERILIALERSLNAFDGKDPEGSAKVAREHLRTQLALPANASAHKTTAMGHAHIDSAWLWPVRETKRKVARTVANVLSLLEAHDEFVFTMSSALQYKWLEENYPQLFARLSKFVEQGRIIPVGGMWVEPDGMVPSGESLARQVLYGQSYFKDKFGKYCEVMWLPDSFGYSGSLPQIAKQGGMNHFLTQKISWNDTNTFPHHSFYWEGIDGTRILTHFPPSDTYGAEVTAQELDRAAKNYRDKAISDHSILLFGYGDGGGGPTREMIERARRFENLEDAPRVTQGGPEGFFGDLEKDLADSDACWSGELYLELHRGTFTTQSNTKTANRRLESMIRQAEAAATIGMLKGSPYPTADLDAAWEDLLLGQFHDILPGTSINWVYQDTDQMYEAMGASLAKIIGSEAGKPQAKQVGEHEQATYTSKNGETVLENQAIKATVNANGHVTSIIDKESGRQLIPEGEAFGKLALYKDEPVVWDAWDIDKNGRDTEVILDSVRSIKATNDDGAVKVAVTYTFGESEATVTYSLSAGSPMLGVTLDVDWHEEEKLLKLLMPFDIHAGSALFESQFGFVERSINENTSWDAARFETCAHRWLHIKEGAFGIGVVNDSSYGYSVGKPKTGGALVGASVLRAPNYPDPYADRGKHTKKWGIIATGKTADVVDAAEQINLVGDDFVGQLVQVQDASRAIRVSAIKAAHDGSGDIIIRLYESLGTRAKAKLEISELIGQFDVEEVDFVENPYSSGIGLSQGDGAQADGIELCLRPFQVATLRLKRK